MNDTERYFVSAAACALNGLPAPDPSGINIAEFTKLASASATACLIYPALRDSGYFRPEAIRVFENAYMNNLAQQVNRDHEMEKLFDFCREKDIKVVALKGWFLRDLYPDPLMRSSADADIFVAGDDIGAIGDFLVAEGYERSAAGEQHIGFEKKPYVNIEVHFSLTAKGVDREFFTFSSPFSCSHPSADRENVLELDATDGYVYLLTHMIKHLTNGGFGLRSIADVYVYNKSYGKEIDRERVSRELSSAGFGVAEQKIRELSEVWFGGKPDDGRLDPLADHVLSCGTYGNISHAAEIRHLESGNKGRARTLLSRVFLPPRAMRNEYKWLEGPGIILLPVGWICRIARSLFNHGSRQRFKAISSASKDDIERAARLYDFLGLGISTK